MKSLRPVLFLVALLTASASHVAFAHAGGGGGGGSHGGGAHMSGGFHGGGAFAGGFHGGGGHVPGARVGGFRGHEGFHGREFRGDRFGSRGRIGAFAGGLAFAPFAYAPFYADPYGAPYVEPYSAPAYIEQNPVAGVPPGQAGYSWYYCSGSNAYYPYVTDCPEGWQQVMPQP